MTARRIIAQLDRVTIELAVLRAMLAGGDEPLATDPVGEAVERMRAHCRDLALVVGFDGTVNEATAAKLLECSPRTLARWRETGAGPDWTVYRRHPRYSLEALARFWVESTEPGD